MPTKKSQPRERARTPLPQSLDDWVLRIVVKLHDSIQFAEETTVVGHLTGWMKTRLTGGRAVPLVRNLFNTENRFLIQKLMKEAEDWDPTYRPRNLLNYFSVAIPPLTDVEELLKYLRSLPLVEIAYLDVPGEDPQVSPDDDPKFPGQGYLGAAPDGIGAELVWPRADGTGVRGADGTGLNLIDMELGWTLDHEDLGTQGTQPLYGRIVNMSRQHGTSVLGVIGAKDNALGCIGVVPNLASIQVVSYEANGLMDFPNAMAAAFGALQPGDVFLMESQLRDAQRPLPIEALPCVFDLIRNATARGIIVIEPSGNNSGGGTDLGQYADSSGRCVLNPAASGYEDSGAIMVGAASAAYPHSRLFTSNYGTRVNCYAWGESVVTLDSNSGGATHNYRNDFSATSAASAIIAGAALSVQGMAEQNLGRRLSPGEMREILSDRTTGTLSAGDILASGAAVELIGVMPDLSAISRDVLNVTANSYMRQSVADNGALPRNIAFASPDIIMVPEKVDDPNAQFGEGSGTENSYIWSGDLAPARDAWIYVRARNRGGAPAPPTSVTVFWSPLSTLLTPRQWRLVGSTRLPQIPTGDLLSVSEAMRWSSAELPADKQYAVIAVLGTPNEPEPGAPWISTWNDYLSFIQRGHVGVRNLNVVANTPTPALVPDPPDDLTYVALPFIAPGPPDTGKSMQLETEASLPEGSRAWLEAPPLLANPRSAKRTGSTVWLPVNVHGRTTVPESLFLARSRSRLRLLVHIPADRSQTDHTVLVRQLYKAVEVGRVTWRIRVESARHVEASVRKPTKPRRTSSQ